MVMVTWRCHVGVAVVSGCHVGRERLSTAVGGHRRLWAMSAMGVVLSQGVDVGMVVVEEQAAQTTIKQPSPVISVQNVPSDVAI